MLPYSLQNGSKFTTTRLGLSQVITSDCKEGLAIGVEYWHELRPTLVGYPRMGGLDMRQLRDISVVTSSSASKAAKYIVRCSERANVKMVLSASQMVHS